MTRQTSSGTRLMVTVDAVPDCRYAGCGYCPATPPVRGATQLRVTARSPELPREVERPPASGWSPSGRVRLRPLVVFLPTLVLGGAFFAVAANGATYAVRDRDSLAIVIWWAIVAGVALGVLPLRRLPRAAIVTWVLLAAFAAFTGLSLLWATSAERAFAELTRTALFVGVFGLVCFASTRRSADRWTDGTAMAIVGVTLIALGSRFFPQALPGGKPLQFLSGLQTRLSYPVGYWTGLGVLIALALPLLLRIAVSARNPVVRGTAVAALPPLVVALYLASARLGVLVAVVGAALFFVLAPRWSGAAAIGLAAVGSAAALAIVLTRPVLIDGPFDTHAARHAGAVAAALIAGVCLLVATAFAFGCKFVRRPPSFSRGVRLGLYGGAAAVAVVVVIVADPRERFAEFKQPPSRATETSIRAHLFNVSSNARWQLWSAAVKEGETEPLHGRGAGSFEAWWAQHGTVDFPTRDAHSLVVETFGELGVVGLVLIVAALGSGLVVGVRRLRGADGDRRVLVAALLSAYAAYVVSATADWMWEFTAVSVVGVTCLALLTGPATAEMRESGGRISKRRLLVAGRTAVVCLGLGLIVVEATPLLTDMRIRQSQGAVNRGDLAGATSRALSAVSLEPWAASPYLQVALVEEQKGTLASARSWIARALQRDPIDWHLWYVKARIESKQGDLVATRADLRQARRLNPRSVLFVR
jgi:hypothetical protein